MAVVAVVLLFALGWTKSCKPVKYEFQQYGVKHYGWGASKGCFTDTQVMGSRKAGEDFNVTECSAIKKDADLSAYGGQVLLNWENEQLESYCNYQVTAGCIWKSGKCQAASCPDIAAKYKCSGGQFKNGKCEKRTGDNCTYGYAYLLTPNDGNDNCNDGTFVCPEFGGSGSSYCYGGPPYYCEVSRVPCSKIADYYDNHPTSGGEKLTADDKKICEYACAHPTWSSCTGGPYQDSVANRKYCNNQLGCLYAENGSQLNCSVWAIWAFVLALVLSIVTVVGAVVFVIVAHFVLKLF